MMIDLKVATCLLLCVIPVLLFFFINLFQSKSTKIPKSYPIIGSYFSILPNKKRWIQWTSDLIQTTPNLTFTLIRPFGFRTVITANPCNVQHMLKTHFHIYQKGDVFKKTMADFLGDGIINADGEIWKYQRQVASHEFNTKSLRKFVETVVDTELNERLIPLLAIASIEKKVVDFQDILQRFAFDNICKIAFGYDPAYLLPSLPQEKFAVAFEEAARLSNERLNALFPFLWKIKRIFNIGTEKKFRIAVNEVRQFAKQLVKEKHREISEKSSLDSVDLLSRFLSTGHKDDSDFITDIVISFILAGRDTTSAALTWFFWLISGHSQVENEILKEIKAKSESPVYDEVKDMIYTHASLCESMRFYPPVPVDAKTATEDDIFPDGTFVKKGTRVTYHPYAMGRAEKLWGKDWPNFRPERWLDKDQVSGNWIFVARDMYTYPIFQAGPRICLGKEMAFLQMKRVVAGVLRRFRVVPVVEKGVEPVYVSNLTAKMKGGYPVTIEERNNTDF